MSSTILSNISIAATATGTYDLNLRQEMRKNMVIVIVSTKALSVDLYDGIGGDDPVQLEPKPVPYVAGGSSVPIYDGTGTNYTVAANVNKEIRIDRTQLGDWLKVKLSNTEAAAATINIYGTFI